LELEFAEFCSSCKKLQTFWCEFSIFISLFLFHKVNNVLTYEGNMT